VRDEREHRFVDARESGVRAVGEARELDSVVGGKVLSDEQDLLFDQVVVVEKPLARGGRAACLARRSGQFAVVGGEVGRGLLGEGDERRRADAARRSPGLCRRKLSGLLGEAFGREQLPSQGAVIADRAAEAVGCVFGHRTPCRPVTAVGWRYVCSMVVRVIIPERG